MSVTPLKRSTESVVDGPPSKRPCLPIDATKLSNGVDAPTFISEQPRPCTPSKGTSHNFMLLCVSILIPLMLMKSYAC